MIKTNQIKPRFNILILTVTVLLYKFRHHKNIYNHRDHGNHMQ